MTASFLQFHEELTGLRFLLTVLTLVRNYLKKSICNFAINHLEHLVK